MTVDEKLRSWREATESLAPSAELQAALRATVDAPPPPAAPGTLMSAVKVIFVTALVGAAGFVLMQTFGVRWLVPGSQPHLADGGHVALVTPGLPASPAPVGAAAQALQSPAVPVAVPVSPQFARRVSSRDEALEYRRQMKARPLTCDAQRRPIEGLLALRTERDTEQVRLLTRLTYLCGASPILVAQGPAVDGRGGPALAGVCARFLRGELAESDVRGQSAEAWCLKSDALAERDWLRAQGTRETNP